MNKTLPCPECGAHQGECTHQYHHFLALEMTHAGYGIVHHLTVAAYMLQHPSQLSLKGWQEMQNLLGQFVNDGLTPAHILARHRKARQNRSWSLIKGPHLELPPGFSWTQTILSVDASTPTVYCQDIERWARQVWQDSTALEI